MVFVAIKQKKLMTNPVFWLGSAWIFVTGLYYTSGYVYEYPLKASGLLYFWGTFVAFAIGFAIALYVKLKCEKVTALTEKYIPAKPQEEIEARMKKMNNSIHFLIIFAGFALFVIDFFIHNSLLNSENLHTEVQASAFGTLGKCILLGGLILWLYGCVYAIRHNEKPHITSCIAAVLYLSPAVLTSGRQSMFVIAIATISVLMFALHQNKKYKYIRLFYISLIAVAFLLVAYCVYVAIARQEISNKAALFEYMFQCDISDKTANLMEKTGPLKSFFLEIVSYYSHELPMFQVLFDHWDGTLFLGSSQFQLISRNLPASSFFYFDNVWAQIEEISASVGAYSHVWRTMAGNCVMDFGRVGGLFFMAILGFISGKVYKKAHTTQRAFYIVFLSMVNAACFFSLQFSPFAEGFWYFPMCWLLLGFPIFDFVFEKVWPYVEKILPKIKSKLNFKFKK